MIFGSSNINNDSQLQSPFTTLENKSTNIFNNTQGSNQGSQDFSKNSFLKNAKDENYLSNAIRLKNENIFAIYDKLYEFKEESINKGAIRSQNKFRDDFHIFTQSITFPDPENSRKRITKQAARYQCNWIMEVIGGKLMFTFDNSNSNTFLIDSLNLEE